MKKLFPLVAALALCGAVSRAQEAHNLVPDASFESAAPSWFSADSHGTYFSGREKVAGAARGDFVLAIQGWEASGTRILSAPFDFSGAVASATWKARSFGQAPAEMELALYNESGEQKLASLGTVTLNGNGQWQQITASNVALSTQASRVRLAFLPRGPQEGARFEVDELGVFASSVLGEPADLSSHQWFEAESMETGAGWKVRDHFLTWYPGLPSGGQMLMGSEGPADGENGSAIKKLTVPRAGRYRLWMHFLHTAQGTNGSYSFAVRQNGHVVASREIDDGDAQFGPSYNWVWVSLDADLQAGAIDVVLSRPATGTSWVARHVDAFALTTRMDYTPDVGQFRTPGWVRFTNTSTQAEPYCLWIFVHRHQGPDYYANPGILSDAGLSGSYYAPADKTKWLAPGESSPWVNISDFLLPGGGRNNLTFMATRNSHVEGLVSAGFKGRLEFSVGDGRRIVKTVEVNQDAPRLLMTLPYDPSTQSDEILTGYDYVARSEAALDKAGVKKPNATAKHLDLSAILGFDTKIDDPTLVAREIALIKRMGFNNTYTPLDKTGVFDHKSGLRDRYGAGTDTFYLMKNNCPNQPDTEKIDAAFKNTASEYSAIKDRIVRMKLSDEPSGAPYEHFVSCEFCKNKFREGLSAQGFTPQKLGVASWEEVAPVLPADAASKPELFYQSGLFRLRSFADFARTSVSIKRKYFPDTVKTYVNYSPPLSEQLTWTQRGNDLWMVQRNGGLELGWTEDWLGYGASPQQMSTMYAQLRGAGALENQPMGGYMVGVSGGPLLQRLKYYTMVAAGARFINAYAYGPYYASVDSWSTQYDRFPAFARVNSELGAIDEALEGTTRRKTDIAILYNRTDGIWMQNHSALEQDTRYVQWALSHAGYDADFVDEDDVVAGRLKNYKVLYLGGEHLRRDAATAIANWVQNGGTLSGHAGSGTRDEDNRALSTLDQVFGATSQNFRVENDAGRPKYELRGLPVLDELRTVEGSGAPSVTFNQLCARETLQPLEGAKVILQNKAGQPAGVLNTYGKGRAIRLAAAAGLTYLNDAVRSPDYDIETYLPKYYRSELRDFLTWPASLAQAARVAQSNAPLTQITRYDGAANTRTGAKNRAVIFVVDYNGQPNPQFSMTLPDAARFTKARSATGAPVSIRKAGTSLKVSFALDTANAIVLE